MKTSTYQSTAIIAAAALLFTGCENLTPGQNAALFGGTSGIGAGLIARNAGASTGESIAIGAATGVIVAATVYIIAKRRATARQREIAEERARIANARRQRQIQRETASAKRKKHSRYIAVDTERDSQSTGKKTVMIFDTKSNEVVGNNVYDVKSTPSKGEVAKFDTYSAEYVGTGA